MHVTRCCAGDSDVFLKDMESDSGDEGSSFFGDNADEADSDDEDVDMSQQDTLSMAQHAQRAVQGAGSGPAPAAEAPPPDGKPTPGAQAKQQQNPSGAMGFVFRFPSAPKAKSGATAGSSQPAAEPSSREAATASAAAPSKGKALLGAKRVQQPASPAVSGSIQKQQEAEHDEREALTATDSDDESGQARAPDFMSQYAAAMEAELGQSKIGGTFSRPKQGVCRFLSLLLVLSKQSHCYKVCCTRISTLLCGMLATLQIVMHFRGKGR